MVGGVQMPCARDDPSCFLCLRKMGQLISPENLYIWTLKSVRFSCLALTIYFSTAMVVCKGVVHTMVIKGAIRIDQT